MARELEKEDHYGKQQWHQRAGRMIGPDTSLDDVFDDESDELDEETEAFLREYPDAFKEYARRFDEDVKKIAEDMKRRGI